MRLDPRPLLGSTVPVARPALVAPTAYEPGPCEPLPPGSSGAFFVGVRSRLSIFAIGCDLQPLVDRPPKINQVLLGAHGQC
jgi:hypothetical protein